MGILSAIFNILHPIRAVKRSIKRALIPRPIRRAKWVVGGIANPVDRVGYLARRSVIRSVDKAITPKKRRNRTARAVPQQALPATPLAVPASVGVAKDWMSAVPYNVGSGRFDFEVVGESFYQEHLREVSAGRAERGEDNVTFPCYLRWEINSHTHEPAIRVEVSGGRLVGHFPAEMANIYAEDLQKLEQVGLSAQCQGVLVTGGEPGAQMLGVWLDFKPDLFVPRG